MLAAAAILIVLLLVALNTYSGVRDGAYYGLYSSMRSLIAFLVAMTFCEPLAKLAKGYIAKEYPAYQYFRAISFGLLWVATSTALRQLKVKFTTAHVPCLQLVDRIAGPAFGFLNGVLVSGSILILYTLFPFARYLPSNAGDLAMAGRPLDTGGALLRFYDFVEDRFGGNDLFLFDKNEPMIPGRDYNHNGQPDLAGPALQAAGDDALGSEQYDDYNGNGEWDQGWMVRYREHAWISPVDMTRARSQ